MNKITTFFNTFGVTAKSKLSSLNYKRAGKSLLLGVGVTSFFVLLGFVVSMAIRLVAYLLGAYEFLLPILLIGGVILWVAITTYNDKIVFPDNKE